jgi:hypothetical protein
MAANIQHVGRSGPWIFGRLAMGLDLPVFAHPSNFLTAVNL